MKKGTRAIKVKIVKPIIVNREHGSLRHMVTWQSLDGRLCMQYYNAFEAAIKHALRLRKVGRAAKVWYEMYVD